MESTNIKNLTERTRHRDASVWVALDWGGLMAPLSDVQAALNVLGRHNIENYLAASDETWEIKSRQRDRTDEIDQAELTQARQIVDNKAAVEREKLSIQIATDEHVLAVRVYDAKVRALLMAARVYAAQVELEQLETERRRAVLAVAKEELRTEELNAKVYHEIIARAQVEVELARAQVDVAKAHVRALMADIEAGRAQVDLVEAEVQKFEAIADKATLQADVAMIFAEIVTKQLSTIKLDVGRQEIKAGYGFLQSKLEDMLAIWSTRTFLEKLKADMEAAVRASIMANLEADKAAEDLREDEVDNARASLVHEIEQTKLELTQEEALRNAIVAWRKIIQNARQKLSIQREDKQTWAQELVNRAQQYVHKHSSRRTISYLDSTELISGGE